MKRWIVNAAERSVRDSWVKASENLQPGEFYWTGTYADAMAAGARRRLAEEAIRRLDPRLHEIYVFVGDRIEAQASHHGIVNEHVESLSRMLGADGWDVWREGSGLVVLGRLPRLVMA